MTIQFNVPGVPVAQPRQRHRIVAAHGRQFVSNYTPARAPVNSWKAMVQYAAVQQYRGAPLDCPITLRAVFVLPRPKAKVWKTRAMPREPHTAKPDAENIVKALLDSLSRVVFRDDSLVCVLCIEKWIAAGDEQPHSEITIEAGGAE